jgi:diaminobutyrate-2-oxoglutarate transaminase
MTIEGADGRRYLDCLSGAGALALGHNHPVVLEAIRRVLDSGVPLQAFDLATPVQDAFITELFRSLPAGLAGHARVQFCGPGETDAVEAAFRLVRAATGRTGVVTFSGARHGMTAEAAALLGEDNDVKVAQLPCPRDHRRPVGVGGAHGSELASPLIEFALEDPEPGGPRPAGVILEPVQGEDGVIAAPDAWMRQMREITTARSIPLIVDEVQTGVGRTGAFWAVQHSGVTPDVMVLSRAIGGSLPLAVLVYRDDLDAGQSGAPAGTFRGNQLAMAAGTATLTYVRENHLAARAATLGARMLDQLRALQPEFPSVGDVRGRGLMIGVEFVEFAEAEGGEDLAVRTDTAVHDGLGPAAPAPAADPPHHPPAPRIAAAVQRECLRRGLIVELGGPHASVVRLLPPLTISDEQATAVLDRLADAVQTVARAHAGRPAGPRRSQEAGSGPRHQKDRTKRAVRRGS